MKNKAENTFEAILCFVAFFVTVIECMSIFGISAKAASGDMIHQYTTATYTVTYTDRVIGDKPLSHPATYGEEITLYDENDISVSSSNTYLSCWLIEGEKFAPGETIIYNWTKDINPIGVWAHYEYSLKVDATGFPGATGIVNGTRRTLEPSASLSEIGITLAGYTLIGWRCAELSSTEVYSPNASIYDAVLKDLKGNGIVPYREYSFVPVFDANADTPYYADIYFENENREYVNAGDRVAFNNGTAGAMSTGIEEWAREYLNKKDSTGVMADKYELDRVENVIVNGDGSSVAKIYYSRRVKNITFDADGGRMGDHTTHTVTGVWGAAIDADRDLPRQPMREGYCFEGWYTERNGKGTHIDVDDFVIFEKDVTYYAYWISRRVAEIRLPDEYSREQSYYTDQDSPVFDLTVIWNDGAEEIVSSIDDDVMWSGFDLSEESLTAKTATLTYAGISASFSYTVRNKTVSISFDLNGGSGFAPIMSGISVGDTVTLPDKSSLSRPGYDFAGWNLESIDTVYNAGAVFSVPTDDIVLTAVWSLMPPTISRVTFDGADLDINDANVEFARDGNSHILSASASHVLDVVYTYKWFKHIKGEIIPTHSEESAYYESCLYLCDTADILLDDMSDEGIYYCLVTATHNDRSALCRVMVRLTEKENETESYAVQTTVSQTERQTEGSVEVITQGEDANNKYDTKFIISFILVLSCIFSFACGGGVTILVIRHKYKLKIKSKPKPQTKADKAKEKTRTKTKTEKR